MELVADSAPPPKRINDTILLWRKTVARRGKDWQNAIRLLFLKEAVSLISHEKVVPLHILSAVC
jgi:hypothetical protein